MTLWHKKRVPAGTQTFVNLKSNTMKNTLQRYDYYPIIASISQKKCHSITFFNQKVGIEERNMLNIHQLPIICQIDTIRQMAIHLFMQTNIMTGMNQIGLTCTYPLSKTDGIVDELM